MNCVICCDQSKRAGLDQCQCKVCSGCLILFIKEVLYLWKLLQQQQSEAFNYFSQITCPGQCGAIYQISELILNPEIQADLNIVLLLKYLQTSQDIRACPNKNCGNFGILPSQKCNEQLTCSQCGNKQIKWNCPELYTTSKTIINSIVNYQSFKDEQLNQIHRFLLTKSCPKCDTAISKNGGCYHMTCKKCNFEFCWHCKQDYHKHTRQVCAIHQFIKFGILVSFILNILLLFEISQVIYHHIVALTFFAMWYHISIMFIVCNTLLGFLVALIYECKQLFTLKKEILEYYPQGNETYSIKQNEIIQRIKTMVTGVVAIILIIQFLSRNSLMGCILFIFEEIVVALEISTFYLCAKFLFKTFFIGWVKFVK